MATRMPAVTEPSEYVLEPIREGADFTIYRGRQHGNPSSVLAIALRRTAVTGNVKYSQTCFFLALWVLNMRIVPVLLLLFFFSYPGVLLAQSTNGSISGRVTDPSKAVIADAKVAAINANTNIRDESTTNDSGEYYLTNLPPGSYRIEIEKTGFQKLIKPDVRGRCSNS